MFLRIFGSLRREFGTKLHAKTGSWGWLSVSFGENGDTFNKCWTYDVFFKRDLPKSCKTKSRDFSKIIVFPKEKSCFSRFAAIMKITRVFLHLQFLRWKNTTKIMTKPCFSVYKIDPKRQRHAKSLKNAPRDASRGYFLRKNCIFGRFLGPGCDFSSAQLQFWRLPGAWVFFST